MSNDEEILGAVQELSCDIADLDQKLDRILNELEDVQRRVKNLQR